MRLKYSRAEMFKGRYMQSRWTRHPNPRHLEQDQNYVGEWAGNDGENWQEQLQRLRQFLKGELPK